MVKDTSPYVVERIDNMVGLMPKGNMGQSSDGEDLRHERGRMKHVRCRNDQPRAGRQGTVRGAGRVARSKCCVKWTLQLDRGMVEMRPGTSFSIGTSLCTTDETEIMGGDCSVSNTAADDCRMLVHHSEDSDATCQDETEAGSVIGLLAMQSGGTVVCLFK